MLAKSTFEGPEPIHKHGEVEHGESIPPNSIHDRDDHVHIPEASKHQGGPEDRTGSASEIVLEKDVFDGGKDQPITLDTAAKIQSSQPSDSSIIPKVQSAADKNVQAGAVAGEKTVGGTSESSVTVIMEPSSTKREREEEFPTSANAKEQKLEADHS